MNFHKRPPEMTFYPESDGRPMADNTLQYQWIVTLKENIEDVVKDRVAFVAGDILWYPVRGNARECVAPDVLVALGRPAGFRGSYKQWEEGNTPPQVVFEVLSPSNTDEEMCRKFEFYQRHGVEEYYLIDPMPDTATGWVREGDVLKPIPVIEGWVSPALGIRFGRLDGNLKLFYPHGKAFRSVPEILAQEAANARRAEEERWRAEEATRQMEDERRRAEEYRREIEAERQRAEAERQRAEQATREAEAERQRTARLIAQLQAAGLTPANGNSDPQPPAT